MKPSYLSPPPGRNGLKVAAVLACLTGAYFAAAYFKHAPERKDVAAVVASPQGATAEEILASIPAAKDGSASQAAVLEGVDKVRKAPDKVKNWVVLGDVLAQRLRDTADQTYYDFSEKAYLHALQLQPDCADAMSGMAWVTGGRHVFDASMDWAHKALAIAPGSADSYAMLGDAHLELGDYEAAFDDYQKMMDLRPDLSSWSRGAYLLWITGDELKAVSLMEKAIRAGGPFAENTAWCRAKLATMHLHEGATDAAAQVLEPSLREHSKNPHVLLAAAQVAVASKDFDVAEAYYKMLMEKAPNHDALAGLGDICAFKGDKEGAEKYYVQVEELHATHLASGVHDHAQMARFLADHDRNLIEAVRLAEQHKLTQNVLEADVLAWVYFKNGDMPQAIEAMKRALSRKTPDAAMHYHAGMIAAAAGDTGSARRHLQTALGMDPQFSLLQSPIAQRKLESLSAASQSAPAETLHAAVTGADR
jgi:tetratricopeptide (TPR) repeat protein